MFKHIMIPLDGTSLAENACPVAISLAKLFSAEITLLHLIEEEAPPFIHGERHLTGKAEAEAYLEGLKLRLDDTQLTYHCHVHSEVIKDVAGGIIEHEQELSPDLIVMSTHGPKRIEQLLRGSLAQRVVSHGHTPLLLVPSALIPGEHFSLRRILVPLDGQLQHEGTIDLARDLALAADSELYLLSVVVKPRDLPGRRASLSRFMPGTTWALQLQAMELQQQYLEQKLSEMLSAGVSANAEVVYGKVTPTIVRTAQKTAADLIILATHGKAGTEAFWANSVASQVQAKTAKALLLIPV